MYKACRNSIVTLEPLEGINNEKRDSVVDPLHAKFRCDKARVISIINVNTGEEMDQDRSIRDENFIYKKGEIVLCDNFDPDIDMVCGGGIHYFKRKEAALSWFYQNNNTFPNGKCVVWHENGNKQLEGFYKNGKTDGECVSWYENGYKEYEGLYVDGQRDGTWVGWYKNGHKELEAFYKNGVIDGKWVWWCENGNKECEEYFKNGKKQYKEYFKNGKKQHEEYFKNGNKESFNKIKYIGWYMNW